LIKTRLHRHGGVFVRLDYRGSMDEGGRRRRMLRQGRVEKSR
jgi:hypothetical protein